MIEQLERLYEMQNLNEGNTLWVSGAEGEEPFVLLHCDLGEEVVLSEVMPQL